MRGTCVVCGKPVSDMELVARREWRRYCCGLLYQPHVPATIPAEAPYQERAAALSEKRDS